MSGLIKFISFFLKRLSSPLKTIGGKIGRLIPNAIKSKLSAINYQLLVIIVLFLILWLNYFWPRNMFAIRSLAVARWPNSISKHIELGKALFNLGDLPQAQTEIKLAQNLYKYWKMVDINGRLKKQIEEGDQYINQKVIIKSQIGQLETILRDKPHYRDVYLQLSILNYQLWQDEKAREYWNKAFYLDPNNEKVQEVGKKIGAL